MVLKHFCFALLNH